MTNLVEQVRLEGSRPGKTLSLNTFTSSCDLLNRSSFTLLDPEASGGAYVNAHHSLTLPREEVRAVRSCVFTEGWRNSW